MYKVGNYSINDTYTHYIEPVEYAHMLIPYESELMMITLDEDGNEVETLVTKLHPFISYDPEKLNITVYTSSARWVGNYTVRIYMRYPLWNEFIYLDFIVEI